MKIEIRRFLRYFGNRNLNSICSADLEKYIHERKQKGSRYGNQLHQATLNREIARLKNLFEEAVRNNKIRNNPARYLKLQPENNARTRVLSREEFQRLLENAPLHLLGIIRLAYFTGMRKGEILGLTWQNVDFQHGVIVLEAAMTKTNRSRVIPLNDEMVQMLHEQETYSNVEHPYVFYFRGEPMKDLKRSFVNACEKAGIENFRFHDLRHTFVTNARKAGVHDHVIMAITGHTTMAMFRRYDKVTSEDLGEAAKRYDAFVKVQQNCSAGKKEQGNDS